MVETEGRPVIHLNLKVGTPRAVVLAAARTFTVTADGVQAPAVALVVKFVPYSSFLIGDGEAVDAAVPDFDRDFLPQPMSYKALAGVSSNHVRRFDVKDHQRARANAIPIGTSTNFDYRIAS